MRYRKGSRGLYYKDGKLVNCDYNEIRLNPFEMYWFILHRTPFFSDVWDFLCDTFNELKDIILSILSIPFIGFIFWINARIKVYRAKKGGESWALDGHLEQKFPKDYYEELD